MTAPGVGGRLAAALVGAVTGGLVAGVTYRRLRGHPPGGPDRWRRVNHRGRTVTLTEGPALVAGTLAGVLAAPGIPGRLRAAGSIAVLGAGAVGAYDDLAGSGNSKGFRGHLGALARGEITSGTVKIAGIGLSGIGAGMVLSNRPVDAAVGGAVIAGSANLANLLDLRPGRALKAGLLGAALLSRAGGTAVSAPAGAAVALLRSDLAEEGMLGDCGANALGAALGVAAVARTSRVQRLAMLAVIAALTAASEKISFTSVIERTPVLRELDALGRRPPGS